MIYTIGFTQKTAENFFTLLKKHNIDLLIDVRLNNTSQLSGFTKFPDIQYFANELCKIEYIHDKKFSPTRELLTKYKKKEINWEEYEFQFSKHMEERNIKAHIKTNYYFYKQKNICILCSESSPERCHRRLVGNYFSETFNIDIINL